MNQQVQPYREGVNTAREKFIKIADERTWDRESVFAVQAIMKNDYSIKIANSNKNSVTMAMVNAASTGLTLNPANGYAYLVPRDGAIVLDISYKGLLKIATDAGVVSWGRADVVRKGDTFVYRGAAAQPEHSFDPFAENRHEQPVIGAYCFVKTKEGDILTEVMSITDIEKIRSKSSAYMKHTNGKHTPSGPWVDFFEQMCRKAVIKRAAKTWPYSAGIEKLHEAIAIANETEGGYDLESGDMAERLIKANVKPSAGVYETLDTASRERVDQAAVIVREFFDNEDPKGAYDYLIRLDMGVEENMALSGLLPSYMRTALKTVEKTVAQLERS